MGKMKFTGNAVDKDGREQKMAPDTVKRMQVDIAKEKEAIQSNIVAAAKEAQRRNAGTGIDDELQAEVRLQVDHLNSLSKSGAGRGHKNPPTVYAAGGTVKRGWGKARGGC